MVGQTFSHYRVLDKIGEGGMGVVYVAQDTLSDRRVAIKTLTGEPDKQHFRARLLREARSVSSLNHPHIAAIYEYGEAVDGRPFIVMELVKGQTLRELLRERALPLTRAVEIVRGVAEALAEAHRHGIVHRDIKPSNIAIDEHGTVKVLDFGLAKHLDTSAALPGDAAERQALSATETREGIILGTPAYLSPEQALGLPVDARSDIFSLGSLLYECLTGQPAYSGLNWVDVCAKIIREELPPPSQVNSCVPPELDHITLKALAKRADTRYQSADELLSALTAISTSLGNTQPCRPVRSLPRGAAALVWKRLLLPGTGWRASLGAITILSLVALLALTRGLPLWPATRHQPSPEVRRWYQAGTEALREGSYYKASESLKQAIQADEAFPLARARLAEAWTEMDYDDRARDEMLHIAELMPERSALSPLEVLYLQAITATVRHNFEGAVKTYTEIARQAPDSEKPGAYFDLGRAYEKTQDVEQAIANYEEATRWDSNYASAFLRLGALYGRQQAFSKADAAFDSARTLYEARGNFEGLAEVLYQRGNLSNVQDKLPKAREQLQQALELSVKTANRSQQIKTLLQLSRVFYSEGDTTRAGEYAHEATELASAEQLDNLTTSGLIDIGNTFFLRGEYDEADKHFNQALQVARANKGRLGEARALLSLGSLRIQQGDGGAALGYIEPALAFYRQGSFRRETSQALILFGYANQLLGNYEAALSAFTEQLELAEQVGDTAQVGHAHAAIGLLLSHQERFPEALAHFTESYNINKSLQLEPKVGYDLLNRGNLLWQLGRYQEARDAFEMTLDIARHPGSGNKQLLAWSQLFKARMALSELRYDEAIAQSGQAARLVGTQDKEIFVLSLTTRGLAQSLSGTTRACESLCRQALDMAANLHSPRLMTDARLALAESALRRGDARTALEMAQSAQASAAQSGQQHSAWLAVLISAIASRRLPDEQKARAYAAQAAAIQADMRTKWGLDTYEHYRARPDLQRYQKQLDEIPSE